MTDPGKGVEHHSSVQPGAKQDKSVHRIFSGHRTAHLDGTYCRWPVSHMSICPYRWKMSSPWSYHANQLRAGLQGFLFAVEEALNFWFSSCSPL